MRKSFSTVVAVGLAIWSLSAGASSVAAMCNTGRSPHHSEGDQAGAVWTTSVPPNGVQADIDEYDPWYTAYDNTGTIMSVMLSAHPSDQLNWAQMGWVKHWVNAQIKRFVFTETVDDVTGTNRWQYFQAAPIGSVTNYKITYDETTHTFVYKQDSIQIDNYTTSSSWDPDQWEIFGETHDYVDQMPGGYDAHARFKNIQIRKVGGTWIVPSNMFPHHVPTADVSLPSAGTIQIWDTACAT